MVMAHFVIEITLSDDMQEGMQSRIDTIADIIDSVGGNLTDFSLNATLQVLSLIVEAESEFVVVGLLEANAFGIKQIRHIFLLQSFDEEDENVCIEVVSYEGFFGMQELRNNLAIEVYPY